MRTPSRTTIPSGKGLMNVTPAALAAFMAFMIISPSSSYAAQIIKPTPTPTPKPSPTPTPTPIPTPIPYPSVVPTPPPGTGSFSAK